MPDIKLTKRVEMTYVVEITAAELVLFLTGMSNRIPYNIPIDARVCVQVPGGGDYAGLTLPVDECGGIKIIWTETKQS